MSDINLNIHEAKTHLSRHLNEMSEDDRIVLCRRNVPVAEIRLLPDERRQRRQLGVAKGEFTVLESFFDPLPDDHWRGGSLPSPPFARDPPRSL